MKAALLSLFVVCVLLIASGARADSPSVQTLQVQVATLLQSISSLGAQLTLINYEPQVRQAQAVYNFHLDRLFNIACLNFSIPANAALLNDHLDTLMESFCPDFGTWTAATPGFANGVITQAANAPPSAIGKAQVRSEYYNITARQHTFGCGSQHNVINPVVTFANDIHGRPVATLTSRLWQFAFFAPTNTWADIMGWYDNDWTLENGKWCMSRFFAANDIIVARNLPPNDIDTDLFAFSFGSDQLPPLPRVVPEYVQQQ